jgi:hypothetical protein
VDLVEGPQVGAEYCARCFAGVAIDLALAITMIIPRPFTSTVGHGSMAWMTATIALPLVGIKPLATRRHVVGNEAVAGLPVRVVTASNALRARLARDDAEEGGGRSLASVLCPLRLFARRRGGSVGSRCGVLFSPAFWYSSSASQAVPVITPIGAVSSTLAWIRCRKYAAVCGIGRAHTPDGASARLWQSRGVAAPAWPVVAASWQQWSPSAGSSSRHRPDRGRREHGPDHGTIAVPYSRSEGSTGHLGGGAAPARSRRDYRRVTR